MDRVQEVDESDWADGFDSAEFFHSMRYDVDEMFAQLVGIADSQISDVPLRRLVVELLDEHEEKIKQYPAASRYHHAFTGGFLEHVLSVTQTTVSLADKYGNLYAQMQPPLLKSLVVAGAILHDAGKLAYRHTARGRLIGYILLGRDLVRDNAASIPKMDA